MVVLLPSFRHDYSFIKKVYKNKNIQNLKTRNKTLNSVKN